MMWRPTGGCRHTEAQTVLFTNNVGGDRCGNRLSAVVRTRSSIISILLTLRQCGYAVILDVDGKLTLDDGPAMLREHIRGCLDAGRRKFVLSLANCPYMDSAGLGELTTALVRIQRTGGQLRLVSPTKRVVNLLRVARLKSLFASFRGEAEALRAMT